MGIDSDGILVYGYDLGESYNWGEGKEDIDLENALLEAFGFTEKWGEENKEGYWDRKSAADKEMGVQPVIHCSYDYSMWILSPADRRASYSASRGNPETIQPDDLNIPASVKMEWDAKLNWAIDALGIKPINDEPSWILTSILG